MKVLFFIVNYKADDCLIQLLDSLSTAKSFTKGVQTSIYVLENSQKNPMELKAFEQRLEATGEQVIVLNDGSNVGYFGGLPMAQSLVDDSFDRIVYCNPDIRVEVDFFVALSNANPGAAVLAPSILMESSLVDENPKYLNRLPLSKMNRLKIIYSSGLLYACWTALSHLKERLDGFRSKPAPSTETESRPIYAPHGALFIFANRLFFKSLPAYPCFLFGEELFVAEEAVKAKVSIVYEPSIRVLDTRHASINLLNLAERRRYYLESIEYLLENYYAS